MKKTNLVWGILALGLSLTACQEQTQEMSVKPEDKTAGARVAATQSTDDLKKAYSAANGTTFDAATGTLTFTKSGNINFKDRPEGENTRWDVPANVSTIIINSEVTVGAQFTVATQKTVTIKGVNRKTSIVFGTNTPDYLTGPGGRFITFLASGSGSKINLENLTSLNPKGFHSRSERRSGADMTLKNCRFIDNRGGSSNNSDATHNASLIEGCYFSTGDDVICDYSGLDQTIRNCTINLEQNTIPIQFGYDGPTNGDATLTISNLIITGNKGRNKTSLIQCKNRSTLTNTVRATKTININGLYFRPTDNDKPNGVPIGHIIESDDKSCAYKGTWSNVNMIINGYYGTETSNSSISICGSTSKTTKTFFCGNPPSIANALD